MNLSIKEGVVEIDEREFRDNDISFLQLPQSLEIIGKCAFETNNIDYVILPPNVKSIGVSAFDKDVLIIHQGSVVKMVNNKPIILEEVEWMNGHVRVFKSKFFNSGRDCYVAESVLGVFLGYTASEVFKKATNEPAIPCR